MLLHIDARRRRVYVLRRRLHHGRFGLILLGVGVVLMAHDWKDRPWAFCIEVE